MTEGSSALQVGLRGTAEGGAGVNSRPSPGPQGVARDGIAGRVTAPAHEEPFGHADHGRFGRYVDVHRLPLSRVEVVRDGVPERGSLEVRRAADEQHVSLAGGERPRGCRAWTRERRCGSPDRTLRIQHGRAGFHGVVVAACHEQAAIVEGHDERLCCGKRQVGEAGGGAGAHVDELHGAGRREAAARRHEATHEDALAGGARRVSLQIARYAKGPLAGEATVREREYARVWRDGAVGREPAHHHEPVGVEEPARAVARRARGEEASRGLALFGAHELDRARVADSPVVGQTSCHGHRSVRMSSPGRLAGRVQGGARHHVTARDVHDLHRSGGPAAHLAEACLRLRAAASIAADHHHAAIGQRHRGGTGARDRERRQVTAAKLQRHRAIMTRRADGLGLEVLGSFPDHDGFDGGVLGHPGPRPSDSAPARGRLGCGGHRVVTELARD